VNERRGTNGNPPHGRRATDEPHPAREWFLTLLNSWRFWMILWASVICVTLVVVLVIYSRQSSDRATQRTAAQARIAQCIQSIPVLLKFHRFILGVQDEHRAVLKNAIALRAVTAPASPLHRQLERNIMRLRRANQEVQGVDVNVPTPASCRAANPIPR
jgi:hypothetical protein